MKSLLTCLWIFVLICKLHLTYAQTEWFVKVNPVTGSITKLDSLPGVKFVQYYPAYNENSKEYSVIGFSQPGQLPKYLYTINSESGHIIYSAGLSQPNSIISMQYSSSTGKLYGITNRSNRNYLSLIDKITGSVSEIREIPGIMGVGDFQIDERDQVIYVRAVDNNPNFALWTIDILTGNVINHVSTSNIIELKFDNSLRKLYGLTYRQGPGYTNIVSLATVDPNTGTTSTIADLPGITGVISSNNTLNESAHLYLFTGIENPPQVYLYSLDVTTGGIVNRVPIEVSGVANRNNLVFFRHDNYSGKLYAMYWEANTPVAIDSTCNLSSQVKVFSIAGENKLIIDLKPVFCEVSMNLYNSLGQLIWQKQKIFNGRNEHPLDQLPAGIYFYELFSNNKRSVRGKFIRN